MQGVPVTLVIAEHQRSRTRLSGRLAARQQQLVGRRERRVLARKQIGPAVSDRRELLIERDSRALDEVGKRMREVAISTITEAVARHIDRGAKPVTIEQVSQPDALLRAEQGLGHSEPLLVELAHQLRPVELADPGRDALKGCVGHRRDPS